LTPGLPVAQEHWGARNEIDGFGGTSSREGGQPIECLHYALNLPTSSSSPVSITMKLLDQAFEAARTFKPMSSTDVAALLGPDRRGGPRWADRTVQD